MEDYFLKKWFKEQLYFRLSDGTEAETVIIGTEEYFPIEIIKEFGKYKQELSYWLNEDWKPRQRELREELLNFSANPGRYSDLCDTFERQQMIPFVGSGMSVASGLPTWADFLLMVSEFTRCDISKLKQLIRDSQFEKAADLLAESTNPRLLAERVEHDLRLTSLKSINGPVCLLPKLFPNLVITTNLDRVLEELYNLCDMPFEHTFSGSGIADYRRFKDPRGRFLIKLHGDCVNQKGRVLLSHEYEAAYGPESPSREEIALLCRQYSLLFLGCSIGSDRTVSLLENVATMDANMPKHYAFLAKPTNSAEQIYRENFLTERGIFPIWYDLPHEDSIMALLDGLCEASTR